MTARLKKNIHSSLLCILSSNPSQVGRRRRRGGCGWRARKGSWWQPGSGSMSHPFPSGFDLFPFTSEPVRGTVSAPCPRQGWLQPGGAFGRPHASPPGAMRSALLSGCVSGNTKQKGKAAKSWSRLPCLLISWPAAIAAASGHLTRSVRINAFTPV